MPQIKLSICIPTFNRAAYLVTLLDHLEEVLASLPFETEIIVSDNASTDNTLEILEKAQSRLPLRVLRQDTNLGAIANIHAAICAANGTYVVYLGDDDRLKPVALQTAISSLDGNPNAAALYAPWQILDLVTNEVTAQFYTQPQDVTIPQGNYARLLEHVADHSIYSEICILRRSVFRTLHPFANDIAYWGFTMPCEYLGAGDLIYAQTPFYSSVSCHFVGDTRSQLGAREVMEAWDLYRGGLEYMHGLALEHGGLTDPDKVARFVRILPIERMLTALRLRLQLGGDPQENYALAARLRGLGLVGKLPVPMEQIRTTAALHFACVKLPELLRASSVVVIGDCSEASLSQLNSITSLTVRHVLQAEDICADDMVLDLGCEDHALISCAQERAACHVTEAQLLRKFA